MSVLSMLSGLCHCRYRCSSELYPSYFFFEEPNVESPANVDAAKLYRTNRAAFNERVLATVRNSLHL